MTKEAFREWFDFSLNVMAWGRGDRMLIVKGLKEKERENYKYSAGYLYILWISHEHDKSAANFMKTVNKQCLPGIFYLFNFGNFENKAGIEQ